VNLLPNGRLTVISDCGHLPHVATDRFAAVLSDWLIEHRDQPHSPPPTPNASPDLGEGSNMAIPELCTA
jgi:hypothetical protein